MEEKVKKEVDELDDFGDIEEDDLESDSEEEIKENDGSDDEDEEKPVKKHQTREENARQAKLRREREEKERSDKEKRIRDDAYLKGQLDSIKENPFTKRPVKDEHDLKVLKVQMQLEEEGKDPIEDLPDRLAQLERERSKKAKLESDAKSESEKKLDDDIKDFKEKYPKVNLAKLFEDKTFSKFSEGKLGRETTLATIYQDYLELKETFTGVKEVDDSHSPKKKGSSPSASGGHTSEKTSFSQLSEAEQIKLLKKQGML